MAREAKSDGPRARGKKKTGLNGIDPKELRTFFGQIHTILDEMEEANASARGEIGRIYEKASDRMGVTKSALMLVFKRERRNMKDDAKAAKMDPGEKDSLQKVGQAIGGSIGDWAAHLASKIPDKQAGEEGVEE